MTFLPEFQTLVGAPHQISGRCMALEILEPKWSALSGGR
jgi:hypothetical protein